MPVIKHKKDEVAIAIDEIAELSAIWRRHRKEKRMPRAIRQAIIIASEDLRFLVEMEKVDV